MEEALEQSGLTEDEAKDASRVGTYTWKDGNERKAVNILLKDGSQLLRRIRYLAGQREHPR